MDACCVKISQLYIANSCNQLLIEESSLDQLSTSLQLSRKMVLIELGVERLWPKLRKARQLRFSIGGATMNDAGTLPQHMLYIRELTAEAFAPYGQIIAPLRTGGQGAETSYDPETSTREAKLVLGNGEPRLWIMHLPHVGLGFTRIARHRRVTQCLGSLGGKEWLIGVAPPGDLGDDARPRLEDIAAFRVPGDRLIKLHAATWHAGPHFTHDECLFVNLENLDTNRRDFHAVPLGVECRYRL
jgi:ureidoglycolate hydrolase